MTEKEKAKAYDEAIERVNKLYGNGITEEIFPELKENNNERIRKNCIHFLECQKQHDPATFAIKECIDWIEKQGEQKKQVYFPKFTFDDVLALQCCMGTVKQVQEDKELYEQLNLIHDKIHDAYWIEKQGEQASVKNNERAWLYIVSDVLTWQDGIGQYLDDPRVQELAKRLCKEYEQKLYNHSNTINTVKNEQKSADKVEPKFHKVDWITIDKPCQIININDKGNYIVQYCDDEKTHELSKNFCESYFHFWTIQDAKDGDVLVNGSNIFIFYFINNRRLMGYCHVNMDDGNFYNDIGRNECFCTIDASVTPATKEQRDALMKKINDAGYEWDIEKKELNKKVK